MNQLKCKMDTPDLVDAYTYGTYGTPLVGAFPHVGT